MENLFDVFGGTVEDFTNSIWDLKNKTWDFTKKKCNPGDLQRNTAGFGLQAVQASRVLDHPIAFGNLIYKINEHHIVL